MKKITVVTVVYNALALLKETVGSLVLPQNVEYLIVDGCSNDGTLEYLQELESVEKFDGFRYVSEPDEGVYDAMNKAVSLADGEYIVFMNAGDLFYDDNTLSEVIDCIESEGCPDVVYGDHFIFDELKSKYCVAKRLDILWRRMVFCHQAMYVKTELQKKFPFDCKNLSADHTFIYLLYSRGCNFSYMAKPLARYLDGGVSVQNYRKSIRHRYHGVVEQTEGGGSKLIVALYYAWTWLVEPEKYKLGRLIKK